MRLLRLTALVLITCVFCSMASARERKNKRTAKKAEMEFVDMGLDVLWGSCNLGAGKPSDYGDYYAWGEVEPKEFYSWGNYKYSTRGMFDEEMDKYIVGGAWSGTRRVEPDNKDRLEPADDAASVASGGEWRMPTVVEYEELRKNSVLDTVTIDGVKGFKLTSTVPGFEGNSIFMPFGGHLNGNEPIELGQKAFIWTASVTHGDGGGRSQNAKCVGGYTEKYLYGNTSLLLYYALGGVINEARFKGMNVRPVKPLPKEMFSSISLSAEHLDLDYGEIRKVDVMAQPANRPVNKANITWSSSNPHVADVVEGYLTAVGTGSCTIIAHSEGNKAEMSVTVTLPVPEPVDLGLGVKWASANLGASAPRKAGGYFAWGETSPKAGYYEWGNYKFGNVSEFTKYNYVVIDFKSDWPLDCKTELDPEDDAARVVLGQGWRMPTADDLWELKNKCTWQRIENADSCGYLITSNVPGYEGKSIFIPLAGAMYEKRPGLENAPLPSNNQHNLYLRTSTLGVDEDRDRLSGYSIRPVMDFAAGAGRQNAGPEAVDPNGRKVMVDLGLSVCWADCNVGADSPEQGGARFAWGETEPKTYYSEFNYKHIRYFEESNTCWYSKYVFKSQFGRLVSEPDGKNRLEPADDAACVNWGGKWRIPTKQEYEELIEKCEWTVSTVNGVQGMLVTSKVPGYTSSSIFLPYLPVDMLKTESWENRVEYMTSDAYYPGSVPDCYFLRIRIYTQEELDFAKEFEGLELEVGSNSKREDCDWKIDWGRRFKCYFVRAVCSKQ